MVDATLISPRLAAIHGLQQVVDNGRSLSEVMPQALAQVNARDRSLTQALCFGVCRLYPQLEFLLHQLLEKPLKKRDSDIRLAILCGLYQLRAMRVPDHAAVSETVALATTLNKTWARGLMNAVLRNYQRKQTELNLALEQNPVAHFAHPQWWIDKIRSAWPGHWQAILEANNQPPPMALRVNARKLTRTNYLAQLQRAGIQARPLAHCEHGLILEEAISVEQLPGFSEGAVSVQDGAAQRVAAVMRPHSGDRILDACAAPGGKTAHLLEQQPELAELVAIDVDEVRLLRIHENLLRLGLQATVCVGDAATPSAWWDGNPFDRILLDAPCSASGVIRRHPDIKLLRRPADLPQLVQNQSDMLDALWPLLKPGGMLLYTTCSVLPEENSEQIRRFLVTHPDAQYLPLATAWGHSLSLGTQTLPGEDEMDGFFYAHMEKRTT